MSLHGVVSHLLSLETRVRAGRLSRHALENSAAGAQTRGCAMRVDQLGETWDACVAMYSGASWVDLDTPLGLEHVSLR